MPSAQQLERARRTPAPLAVPLRLLAWADTLLGSVVREHAALTALVVTYVASALILGGPVRHDYLVRGFASYPFVLLLCAILFLLRETWRIASEGDGVRALARPGAWSHVRPYIRSQTLAGVVLVYVLWSLFMPTFLTLKQGIGLWVPYTWDTTFMELDRTLHGGIDPWRIVHPVLADPVLTRAIDWVYSVSWLVMMPLLVPLFSWSLDRTLRMQFLLAVVIAWISLGTLGAFGLASVGPCYYHHLGGADVYAELRNYLDGVHHAFGLHSHVLKEALREGGLGIAAMPSMHVAMSALAAFAAWRVHRLLGVLFWIYLAVILLGSVHLAWHYAVDGYLSLLAVVPIWYFARWLTVRTEMPETQSASH